MLSRLLRLTRLRTFTKRLYFSKEVPGQNEGWVQRYIITGCFLAFCGFTFQGTRKATDYDGWMPNRTRSRITKTYSLFTLGCIISALSATAVMKKYEGVKFTKRVGRLATLGGMTTTAMFYYFATRPETPYAIKCTSWLLAHVAGGLCCFPFNFGFGPFAPQAVSFFLVTAASLGIGGAVSFGENDSLQPNYLWESWIAGLILQAQVIHLVWPGRIYAYYYVPCLYIAYCFTRDSVRTLRDAKTLSRFDPLEESIRIWPESFSRAGRGFAKWASSPTYGPSKGSAPPPDPKYEGW